MFEFYQLSSQSGQRSEMLGGCLDHPSRLLICPRGQCIWSRGQFTTCFGHCLGGLPTLSGSYWSPCVPVNLSTIRGVWLGPHCPTLSICAGAGTGSNAPWSGASFPWTCCLIGR